MSDAPAISFPHRPGANYPPTPVQISVLESCEQILTYLLEYGPHTSRDLAERFYVPHHAKGECTRSKLVAKKGWITCRLKHLEAAGLIRQNQHDRTWEAVA